MSNNFTLHKNLFIRPTPAGAFYAVSSSKRDLTRKLIFSLLRYEESPALTLSGLLRWSGSNTEEDALELLHRAQQLGWMAAGKAPEKHPRGTVEEALPKLLPHLSDAGKVLLADNHGFYLASHGYPHETAEELSALSADLASLYERHEGLLKNNLGQPLQAWGLMDAAGNSQLGFWPLYFGEQRFVLALNGRPKFNQPAFRDMVWILAQRYADPRLFLDH